MYKVITTPTAVTTVTGGVISTVTWYADQDPAGEQPTPSPAPPQPAPEPEPPTEPQ